MFLTYATGVKSRFERVCPIKYESISDSKKSIVVEKAGTLFDFQESVQACYWPLESPLRTEHYIEGESELTLVLEEANNADVYILRGTDRSTAENSVELGDKLYPGNPLRITHLDDLLVVFRLTVHDEITIKPTGVTQYISTGSFQLNYEATGPQYPFWRRPFLEYDEALWYATFYTAAVIVALCPCLIVYCCIIRPCC